jgi:hypothetical protein
MILFDRKIWETDRITNKSKSAWRCYQCEKGSLVLEDLIPKRKFAAAHVKCSSCHKTSLIIGNVIPLANKLVVSLGYYKIQDLGIKPTHIRPTLSLFNIPESINAQIKEKIMLSFDHFWYDLDACANKIRQALELMVKEFGGKGDTLHSQIKSLDLNLGADNINSLIALKWIGNDGSHSSNPFTKEEILDTYEIFVHTINKLYPDNSANEIIESKINKINQNKGIKIK